MTDSLTNEFYSNKNNSNILEVRYEYNKLGRLTSVKEYFEDELQRQTAYTYDPVFDSPAMVALPGGTGSIQYEYNNQGLLSKTKSSLGHEVDYYYDEASRLSEVIDSGKKTQYLYDTNGNLESILYPNNTSVTYSYDNLDRLTYIENKSGANVIFSAEYTLSKTGRRTQVEEKYQDSEAVLQTRNIEYDYDLLGRLSQESYSGAYSQDIEYTYDDVGNRLTKYDSITDATTSYCYNALDQLLHENDGTSIKYYQYDAGGNLVAQGVNDATTHYIYGINNLLSAVYAPGETESTVRYEYDYRGNRYLEETGSGSNLDRTYFQVDNNNLTGYSQVLAEINLDGTLANTSTYGNDLISYSDNPQSSIVNRQYFHYDGLGSTRVLTDVDGNIINRYGYTAFGNAVSSLTSESLPQPYRFTGERYDELTGLYYFRARMYDPSIGRFTTYDPVEDQANKLHKYNYCGNDSINAVDPQGEAVEGIEIVMNYKLVGLLMAAAICSYLCGIQASGQSIRIPTIRIRMNIIGILQELLASGLAVIAAVYTATMSNLEAVEEAIREAARQASKALKDFIKWARNLRILLVVKRITPRIYDFNVRALKFNPTWFVLNYNGPHSPVTTRNRGIVLAKYGPAPPLLSVDEFPFASTKQGGASALGEIVPLWENRVQGAYLRAFYTYGLRSVPGA